MHPLIFASWVLVPKGNGWTYCLPVCKPLHKRDIQNCSINPWFGRNFTRANLQLSAPPPTKPRTGPGCGLECSHKAWKHLVSFFPSTSTKVVISTSLSARFEIWSRKTTQWGYFNPKNSAPSPFKLHFLSQALNIAWGTEQYVAWCKISAMC